MEELRAKEERKRMKSGLSREILLYPVFRPRKKQTVIQRPKYRLIKSVFISDQISRIQAVTEITGHCYGVGVDSAGALLRKMLLETPADSLNDT
jgi:hypothetical protein